MSATPERVVPDLPDDVGDALYEYRQAIRNAIFDGDKKSIAAETTTYAEFVAAFYAHVAARVVVPQEVRTLVETGMTFLPVTHPLYAWGRAWLNALPPLTTPETRDAA